MNTAAIIRNVIKDHKNRINTHKIFWVKLETSGGFSIYVDRKIEREKKHIFVFESPFYPSW